MQLGEENVSHVSDLNDLWLTSNTVTFKRSPNNGSAQDEHGQASGNRGVEWKRLDSDSSNTSDSSSESDNTDTDDSTSSSSDDGSNDGKSS